MYTLFAYTRDPGNRIVRFAVSQEVQESMTAYLKEQVQAFNGDCEEVAFDGKYKPDQGEMLVIDGFDDLDSLVKVVAMPPRTPASISATRAPTPSCRTACSVTARPMCSATTCCCAS